MRTKKRKLFCAAAGMIVLFVLWTVAVSLVDVQPIGPRDSMVGFGAFNRFFHDLTGVNLSLYEITDWLGLVPLCIALGFAFLGLIQWIRRKQLSKVDPSILLLGGFYIVVMAVYVFFELVVINYRPILIDGILEASYPSSTTMLAMCVIPTAMLQFHIRIENPCLRRVVLYAMAVFCGFLVIGRLLSGVHWVADIIGGLLFSAGLVMLYASLSGSFQR